MGKKNAYGVGIGEIAGVGEPATQMVIGGSTSDVVHHQRAGRSAIVRSSHRSKSEDNLSYYCSWVTKAQDNWRCYADSKEIALKSLKEFRSG